MRMMNSRINPREERGATIVIVALCLIAILGMVVLVVDVGGLLTLRRRMVLASDAASLAAAQSCAIGDGSSEAQSNATEFAGLNETGATQTLFQFGGSGCTIDGGTVTVGYQKPKDLFFAPVLGFPDTSLVHGYSTALWGPAGTSNPMPWVVPETAFGTSQCEIDFADIENIPPESHPTCNLMFDNDIFHGSVFGSLNLNKWNVDPGENCSSKDLPENSHYASVGGYDGSIPKKLGLNFPSPTYVCAGDGLSSSLYDAAEDQIGNILVFPITQEPYIRENNGQIDKFNVIGFAALQLDDILTVAEAGGGTGTCSATHNFVTNEQLDLVAFGVASGCFTDPSSVTIDTSTLSIRPQKRPKVTPGQDWTVSGNTVTWLAADRANLTVSFDFLTAGICGPPPPNASARCLVTSWQGGKIGGDVIIPGPAFGVEAMRLCDPDISGSCDVGS